MSLQSILENAVVKGSCRSFVWDQLMVDENKPFETNMQYLDLVNAIFDVRHTCEQLEDFVKDAFALPMFKDRKDTVKSLELLGALRRLHQHGLELTKKRLAANQKMAESGPTQGKKLLEPRIVRLARRFNMSEKETYALAFVVISYGESLWYDLGRGFSFNQMMRITGMTLPEAMHFVSHSRTHVKEGLFSPDEDDPVGYSFKIPYVTGLVLTGSELSPEDMLKIDKTALADILSEEDDSAFQSLRASAVIEKPASEATAGEEKSAEDAGTDAAAAGPDDSTIFDFLRTEVLAEQGREKATDAASGAESESALTPYTTNTMYLADHIEWLSTRIRVRNIARERETDLEKDPKKDSQVRELAAKERMLRAKCEKRLVMTPGGQLPRLEKLAAKMQLDAFEKNVLLTLTGHVISNKISSDASTYSYSSGSDFKVRDLLRVFCDDFEAEIQSRKYFYKSAKMVKEGVIKLAESWNSELMDTTVEIDRRMLDFIVGLDTEFSELVEGSHLYTPNVEMDQVVLSDDTKSLITRTVMNFDNFVKSRKRLGFDEVISYGAGILLMFYGKSGTGKTLTANALAKMMGKRILLINYPSLGSSYADQVIKFIFREAKLQDAVLFFDECESIFLSRDHQSGSVNLLLTEIERHNGLMIMATNRAFDLDEAMHRRITLAVEFKAPDPILRSKIWKAHIPATCKIAEDVNFTELGLKYELTGGLIKNAILYALSEAVTRNNEAPLIEMKDLAQGAIFQLRARLSMVDFDRRVVPHKGLDEIIVEPKIQRQLQQIVHMDKAKQVLVSEWGFSDQHINDQGTTCLFHGPPGCGKTLAAEALGFETGRPLKVVNCAELVSKYVGDTGKNIEQVFKEAKAMDAILVLDDAEALFEKRHSGGNSSTERYANMDTSLLLYHTSNFSGICVVTTNLLQNIDEAFFRRFRFIIEFPIPDAKLREKLWRSHLPAKAPLDKDVDLKKLAETYKISGGFIKNITFKAASSAALRPESAERVIRMKDLVEAAEEDPTISGAGKSAAASMFN